MNANAFERLFFAFTPGDKMSKHSCARFLTVGVEGVTRLCVSSMAMA